MGESHILSAKIHKYYQQKMERLLSKHYVRTVDGGKVITIGFTPKGNKHLVSDTYGYKKTLQRVDLPRIDKLFERASFVRSAGLSKPRKDNIVAFHYFKLPGYLHGNTAYINVAEENEYHKRTDGETQIRKNYYVYSIVDRLYKRRRPRS